MLSMGSDLKSPQSFLNLSCRGHGALTFLGKDMRWLLIVGLVVCAVVLSHCIAPPMPPPAYLSTARPVGPAKPAQPPPDNSAALAAARQACATQYPAAVGTFLARATCVNEAIDRIALPNSPNPDLIQLQESARIALSTKLDDRTISQKAAETTMAEIDAKVTSIEHYRAISDQSAAASQLTILNDLVASTN
jgi:hypothetical protein